NIKNLSATKGYLEVNGFEVETTQSPEEALSRVTGNEYALVLLDFQMPKMNWRVKFGRSVLFSKWQCFPVMTVVKLLKIVIEPGLLSSSKRVSDQKLY